MSLVVIGGGDAVSANDKLTITFRYSSILPEFTLTENGVISAIGSLGYNVLTCDVDTFVGFRKIVVTLRSGVDATAGVIGAACADAINEHFWSVFDCSADQYQIGEETTPFTPSTQTAVSLASIAVLALVGFGLFVMMKGKLS